MPNSPRLESAYKNMTFKRTYLIQSLNKPIDGHGIFGKINPFSFGGGGSGLSKEALEGLSELWDWEYMGAAEYEFGAPRKALQMMVNHANDKVLKASVIMVDSFEAKKNPHYDWYDKTKVNVKIPLYIIAHKDWSGDIEQVLQSLLTDKPVPNSYGKPSPIRLKCNIPLWEAAMGVSSRRGTFIGGLELDNGWQFFVSYEHFKNVCGFWGLECPDKPVVPSTVAKPVKSDNSSMTESCLRALGDGTNKLEVEIFNMIAGTTYAVGDRVAEEHIPQIGIMQKALKSLLRKKAIIKREGYWSLSTSMQKVTA